MVQQCELQQDERKRAPVPERDKGIVRREKGEKEKNVERNRIKVELFRRLERKES